MTPGRTGHASARRGDVWASTIVGWHVAFAAMLAIGAIAVLLDDDLSPRRTLAALAALALLAVAYVVLAVPADLGDPGWRGTTYLWIAVAATGIGCSLSFALSLVLFVVYPQVWLLSRNNRQGVVLTVAVTAAAFAGIVTRAGWSLHAVRDVGPQLLVSLLFSLVLGLWIARVIDQSRGRADLITELETARAALADAHHAAGVMAERERMAREIHDTLAQGFTSVVTLAQAAARELDGGDTRAVGQRLEVVEQTARDNLAEARALVAAYSPAPMQGTDLPGALRRLAERFTRETGVPVTLDIAAGWTAAGPEVDIVLLRTAQEALANVRKHADATSVTLVLALAEGDARIEVRDDGRGFGVRPGERRGLGLAGMRHRVESVGGDVAVTSEPGAGTAVVVRVPS